jgi:hypothetical protein
MPTVTVSLPGTPDAGLVVPGRVRLTLAELLVLARAGGDLVLPIHLDAASPEDPTLLEERLSGGTPTPSQRAHALLAERTGEVDDPAVVRGLREAGLLTVEEVADPADGSPTTRDVPLPQVQAALSLLASPDALLTLDLAARDPRGEAQLRSWFALGGSLVAQLSTTNGLEHELAWCGSDQLGAALERGATLSLLEDGDDVEETVPDGLRLPYDLLLAGTEAVRRNRGDIVDDLVRRYAPGTEVPDDRITAAECLTSLEQDCLGRLRVTVAVPGPDGAAPVAGLVSWTLLRDGWRWLEPRSDGPDPAVVVHKVAPHDLGRVVAPVLAQVVR